MSDSEIIDSLVIYNKNFPTNCPLNDTKGWIYKKGNIPILISAPHTISHYRNNTIKLYEKNTGSLALLLSKMTGCHIIYRSSFDKYDPNYDPLDNDGGYKRKLIDIVNTYNIKYVFDLHGAKESNPFDIEIGTNHGKTINFNDNLIPLITNIFKSNNITKIFTNYRFTAGNHNTITNCIASNTKACCLQLEINYNYRNFDNPDNIICLVKALNDIIEKLK